jgi:hypothetical protein
MAIDSPGTQAPERQMSFVVQMSFASQDVLSGAGLVEQVPSAGLHVPGTRHGADVVHVTGLPPVHAPDWQASPWVHALPSLHPVPFGAAGFEHWPLVGSQVPATWHWSRALQVTGFEPVHVPSGRSTLDCTGWCRCTPYRSLPADWNTGRS